MSDSYSQTTIDPALKVMLDTYRENKKSMPSVEAALNAVLQPHRDAGVTEEKLEETMLSFALEAGTLIRIGG